MHETLLTEKLFQTKQHSVGRSGAFLVFTILM